MERTLLPMAWISGSLCFTPWEDLLQVDEIQKTKRAILPGEASISD